MDVEINVDLSGLNSIPPEMSETVREIMQSPLLEDDDGTAELEETIQPTTQHTRLEGGEFHFETKELKEGFTVNSYVVFVDG